MIAMEEYKLKGTEGEGCLVLRDAQRRWVTEVRDNPHADYEVFVRKRYLIEARAGTLWSLSKDREITDAEVWDEDLYSLCVRYEDGTCSKAWAELSKVKESVSAYMRAQYHKQKAWRLANCVPLKENPKRYRDERPCSYCGGHIRLISTGSCCVCDFRRNSSWEERQA